MKVQWQYVTLFKFEEENIRPFEFVFNPIGSPEQKTWVVKTLFEASHRDLVTIIASKLIEFNHIFNYVVI